MRGVPFVFWRGRKHWTPLIEDILLRRPGLSTQPAHSKPCPVCVPIRQHAAAVATTIAGHAEEFMARGNALSDFKGILVAFCDDGRHADLRAIRPVFHDVVHWRWSGSSRIAPQFAP